MVTGAAVVVGATVVVVDVVLVVEVVVVVGATGVTAVEVVERSPMPAAFQADTWNS